MKIIDAKPYSGRVDEFTIVDTFPDGYFVWNIGRHNFQHECYVPLARPHKELENHVDITSLKAIKVESKELALIILRMASRRKVTKKSFESIVNKS